MKYLTTKATRDVLIEAMVKLVMAELREGATATEEDIRRIWEHQFIEVDDDTIIIDVSEYEDMKSTIDINVNTITKIIRMMDKNKNG